MNNPPKLRKNKYIENIILRYGDAKEIAQRTGYTKYYISQILTGKFKNEVVIAAAKAIMERRELAQKKVREEILENKEIITK